jgi:hypothetical protein
VHHRARLVRSRPLTCGGGNLSDHRSGFTKASTRAEPEAIYRAACRFVRPGTHERVIIASDSSAAVGALNKGQSGAYYLNEVCGRLHATFPTVVYVLTHITITVVGTRPTVFPANVHASTKTGRRHGLQQRRLRTKMGRTGTCRVSSVLRGRIVRQKLDIWLSAVVAWAEQHNINISEKTKILGLASQARMLQPLLKHTFTRYARHRDSTRPGQSTRFQSSLSSRSVRSTTIRLCSYSQRQRCE